MEEMKRELELAVEKLFDVRLEVNVSVAPENTGADYATNVAMQLAKVVHKAPMVVAQLIAEELRDSSEPASGTEETARFRVEVAAPGFLNFISPDEYYSEKIGQISGDIGVILGSNISPDEYDYAGKTVVAEFSDPNPFKVLHVGHLYTSVVGDSISRLLELAGAKVVRANFGGDVGLHVAKTLWALKGADLNELNIEDIAKAYVEGTRAYEEDETAKAEITKLNKEIYRINAENVHEGELAQMYWRGRELSYQYFEDFYARIGVKFDKYYPESTVADRGLSEVRAHTGTTYEESDGAIVYKGEKVGLHTRVFINKEGVPTYEAKDVGLIFTKWDDWHFDESVVVTGNEQKDYMRVVLASVSEYAPQLVDRTRHLTHGLVKLPGGVKMSSRKGNFLKAVDVLQLVEEQLQDSFSRATTSLDSPVRGSSMSNTAPLRASNLPSISSEITSSVHTEEIIEPEVKVEGESVKSRQWKIVLAAIKYAFLKYKMGGDIVFDPQESVSMTGNSGVYLLYSAVRAKKVLAKCGAKDDKKGDGQDEKADERDEKVSKTFERQLSKKIVQYGEMLKEAVAEKAPYKVCVYLYELAQEFSRFYEHVRVAGSAREGELVKVVRAYLNVMEHGLGLLGIEVPESM